MNRWTRYFNPKGFTLIEMAVVLIVVGIIISIVAGVLPSLIASSKIKQAKAIMERADLAIRGYALARNRLPFADTDNDGQENAGAYIGTLPYQTLGLPFREDIWGNALKYAVYGGGAASTADLTQTFADANAFCTEIANAMAAAFDSSICHILNDSTCPAPTAANASNQAYILASPGLKDLGGAAGKYDGCNTTGGAGFNSPDEIITNTYDDLVIAYSLAELNQYKCTGSDPGGTPTVEICNDLAGADEDGDGLTNCADPDCATHPSCSTLAIDQTTIPSGDLNSSYMTGLSATGGTTPYAWSVTGNGGFADLAINSGTGTISATLNQCPGNYTIGVQVQDATAPTALTASRSFTLTVNPTLTVTGATPVTWSSSTQEETYTANGERLGTVNWTLATGGATGFSVFSTGANTCVLRKTGSTTPGTYTFTITATDATCSSNTDDMNIDITVTSGGSGTPGGIGGEVDTNNYDAFLDNLKPDLIHVTGNVYITTLKSSGNSGWLKTVEILPDGTMNSPSLESWQFAANINNELDIIQTSGNYYAVAYDATNDRSYVSTFYIDDNGDIWNAVIDTWQVNNAQALYPDIIHVSGEVFAVAYSGPGNDGYIRTFQIDTSGQIGASEIDTIEFNTTYGSEPMLVQVSGDIYAVVYRGPNDDGYVATVQIAADGQIANSVIDTLEFDTGDAYEPQIISAGGDIYAIAYRGAGDDGFVTTVQIAADGQITDTVLDSLEFDPASGYEPSMVHLAGYIYAVAYRGPGDDGFLTTFEIDAGGLISDAVLDTLEFDTTYCADPSLLAMNANLLAVYYTGPNNKGRLVTISMD